MPEQLDHVAQEVGPYGDISGSGLGNLLGAPHLDGVELVVRESIQNSWDARDGDGRVRFSIRSFVLGDKQAAAFQHYCRNPAGKHLDLPKQPRVLFVSDRGTRGLAGPLDPRQPTPERRDFINFVYMIGETKDVAGSGGTYGYGRSSFFVASAYRTVFVHTRVREGDELQERFVGIAWRKASESGGKRYTGRNWLGRKAEDGNVRPVVGTEACDLARELGFPPFEGEDTGTNIMVLDPTFSDLRDAEEGEHTSMLERLRSAVLWNCWPRLVSGEMQVELEWDGDSLTPSPHDHAVFEYFVRAWQKADEEPLAVPGGGHQLTLQAVPRSGRPKRRLGTLVCHRGVAADRDPVGPYGPLAQNGGRAQSPRHVALMRSPGLVVRYVTGPDPLEGQDYAGVFIANPEWESIFSRSEPPSHDDWVAKHLATSSEKTTINKTFSGIREQLTDWLAPPESHPPDRGRAQPLARVADMLGELVPDSTGTGGGRPGGGGGSGGGGAGGKPRPRLVEQVVQREVVPGGQRIVVAVRNESRGDALVRPHLKVLVDGGGAEKSPPEGAPLPQSEGWDGEATGGTERRLPAGSEARFTIFQPHDCVIDLRFVAKEA